MPVLLSAVPLKEDLDEVAPVSSALAAMLINPDLAPRLAPQKNSLLQVRGLLTFPRHCLLGTDSTGFGSPSVCQVL